MNWMSNELHYNLQCIGLTGTRVSIAYGRGGRQGAGETKAVKYLPAIKKST